MTTVADAASIASVTWSIGTPRLTAGLHDVARVDHASHLLIHGPLPAVMYDQLLAACDAAALLGRGGAAFPVSTKLRSLPRGRAHAVIANGSESEPTSAKDRLLMRRTPHLLLDGVELVAGALSARTLAIAVHDAESAASLESAIAERGPGRPRVRVVRTPRRFVAGEARAVIRGVEGRSALPTGRRTLPTLAGLHGRPTFLSNVETFAQLAVLARMGRRYADAGIADEPGTSLVTIGGAVARPAVVEVPTGVPLRLLLDAAGAHDVDGIVLGGYHGTVVRDAGQLAIARPTLRAAGLSLGAGVMIALSGRTCPLAEVAAVAAYLAAESAGQCGPCVFGLPAVAADLRAIESGSSAAVEHLARHLGVLPGRGACAHPDGATRFVSSFLHAFADDVRAHAANETCGRPLVGELPLGSR